MLRARYLRVAAMLAAVLSLPAHAQQPIVYPSKGQTTQLQSDQGEGAAWAKQTTSVAPMAVAQSQATQPAVLRKNSASGIRSG